MGPPGPCAGSAARAVGTVAMNNQRSATATRKSFAPLARNNASCNITKPPKVSDRPLSDRELRHAPRDDAVFLVPAEKLVAAGSVECDRVHRGGRCREVLRDLARCHVPHKHPAVQRTGGEPPSIAAECETAHRRAVALEGLHLAADGHVPEKHLAVFASAREQ